MTEPTQIRLLIDSEEVTIVLSDGGIACIRIADDIDEDTPRIATTDYYQTRLTDLDTQALSEDNGVWELLAEQSKIYNDDFSDLEYNSMHAIRIAVSWLGHDLDDCVLVDTPLFPLFDL